MEHWLLALTGSLWVFVALFAFAALDGVIPPIPSESVVIALAALSASSGDPNVWAIAATAAAGAFAGDQCAYLIGRRVPLDRIRMMQGKRARAAMRWAERALHERGAAFIISARYVPVGRVAANMTAGAVQFPRRRFSVLGAIAAVTWSGYSVVLGLSAGAVFADRPVIAVGVGVVGGVVMGLCIDAVLRRRRHRPTATPGILIDGSIRLPGEPLRDRTRALTDI